jgi:hypothetical protein
MLTIIILSSALFSANAFSETQEKPDPNSQINAQEQVNSLPGAGSAGAYSVRTRKSSVKAPVNIAPVENITPASCADSLGSKGSATFTACEAGKKTR